MLLGAPGLGLLLLAGQNDEWLSEHLHARRYPDSHSQNETPLRKGSVCVGTTENARPICVISAFAVELKTTVPPPKSEINRLFGRHVGDSDLYQTTVCLATHGLETIRRWTPLRRDSCRSDEAPNEHDGDCHQAEHDSPLHGNHLTFQDSSCFAPDGADVRVP